jgi:hypothetical protein
MPGVSQFTRMQARRKHWPGRLHIVRCNGVKIKLFGLPGQESRLSEELTGSEREYFRDLKPGLKWHGIVAVPAKATPGASLVPPAFLPNSVRPTPIPDEPGSQANVSAIHSWSDPAPPPPDPPDELDWDQGLDRLPDDPCFDDWCLEG